jgi:hypothetical protein
MAVGPGVLKLAGGLGTAAVIGASAVAVAADTRPGGAPLKPPVASGGAQASTAAPTPSAGGDPALVIPITPVCQKGGSGATTAAPAALDPAVAAAVTQLRAATTQPDRQRILATLTADQRMQVTALIAAQRPQQGGAGRGGACRGFAGTATGGTGTIAPTEVTPGGPSTPLVVTTVS